MVTALVAALVVCVIALGIAFLEVWGLPRRRRRVMVNLLGDEGTLDGVLWFRRGAWIILKDARLLRPNGETVPVDGEVMVDKRQVSFIQVP